MPFEPTEENYKSEQDFSYIDHCTRSRRRNKHRTNSVRIILVLLLIVVLSAAFVCLISFTKSNNKSSADNQEIHHTLPSPAPTPLPPTPSETSAAAEEIIDTIVAEEPAFLHETEQTVFLGDEFPSKYVLLIDAQTGEILAEKNAYDWLNPASMTKVLTLLVAVENIADTEGTFTMTSEISEYCYVNECSVVGYIVGETVPIEELFYGCILCSGADASLALAELAAGSHDEFVRLMNQKLDELGLSETAHFTNCVGLYDKEHGCTSADMALIMKAALENEKCRQIICTKVYYSIPTPEHPDGQVLSNWFVRSLEDKNNGDVNVLGGKRGYVPESGNCAVSYGETESGKSYICVTGRSYNQKQTIYDHAALYKGYCSP